MQTYYIFKGHMYYFVCLHSYSGIVGRGSRLSATFWGRGVKQNIQFLINFQGHQKHFR
jgi:hypothetical protein